MPAIALPPQSSERAGRRPAVASAVSAAAAAFLLADVTHSATAPLSAVPLGVLSFAAYALGSDNLLCTRCATSGEWLPPQCILELTDELFQAVGDEFDGLLTPELLQEGLVMLSPRVELHQTQAGGPGGNELARTDYPFISDADVERLLAWCGEQLYPDGQPSELDTLLHEAQVAPAA